jgi:hypothetical protein
MEKRYQVFVSSTYADLKEERRKVIQALIEMDCIPAGMELFPAADEDQFHFIKRVIDDCDYYLLIIGGRYGTLTAEGISYTEKEYDYAVSRELKVIALLHEDPGKIAFEKSEQDPALREKLEAFRKRVSTGRLVKTWKSVEELPSLVTVSLVHTMKTYSAVGWIRANKAASEDLLTEINDLRKQNAQLQEAAGKFSPRIENLAGLDDTIELYGTYWSRYQQGKQTWTAKLTWAAIFGYVSPYLVTFPSDESVKEVLSSAAFKRSNSSSYGESPTLDDQLFRTIAVQLKALGLVSLQYAESTTGIMLLFWRLTPSGDRLMMELRTVKKVKESEQTGKNKEAE